ncbi:MAG: MarR family transcriptional regulator [Lentilitoribacter sp.]
MIDYEKIPLHWVNRLSFLTRKTLSQGFEEEGLFVSAEEWAILLILWSKGEQTPTALADVTFRDRTTITRLIDQMVKKQFVVREHDEKDRRRVLIKASGKGQALKDELVPIAKSMIATATSGISPQDIETTVKTLNQMTNNLLSKETEDKSKGAK